MTVTSDEVRLRKAVGCAPDIATADGEQAIRTVRGKADRLNRQAPAPRPGLIEEGIAERISAIAAELDALHRQLRVEAPTFASASEAALSRLLLGRANSQDATCVRVPIPGARVLVIRCEDERSVCAAETALVVKTRIELARFGENELVVLVAGYPHTAAPGRQPNLALEVATSALRSAPTAVAGISSRVTSEGELAAAYDEASSAAGLATQLPERYSLADEQWAALGARRLAQEVSRALTLDNPLARLRRYDSEQRTDLLMTAATWLANNCDTPATAAALLIHPNTLRYRLRRACQVSGLDLDDPRARLLTLLVAGTA